MLHMDIGTTNALIAARQENVARMLQESRRRSGMTIAAGMLLVRIGEWLRRDIEVAEYRDDALPARRRPQVA